MEQRNFAWALTRILAGQRVCREGWNGKGMWIAMMRGGQHEIITQPYIYMSTAQGDLIPWVVSQADLFADDWDFVASK